MAEEPAAESIWASEDTTETTDTLDDGLDSGQDLPTDDTSSDDATEEEGEESGLSLPGEDASDEEWQAFYRKTGAPESADGYDDAFANLEDFSGLEEMKAAFLKAGLRPGQAKLLTEAYKGVAPSDGPDPQETLDKLRADWGKDFDQNIGLAIHTARAFGGDELMESLQRTKKGNDPVLIKTFASLGKALVSEGLIDGKPVGMETRTALLERANAIMESQAYLDRHDPGHERALAEVNRLYEQAYPEKPGG